MTKTQTKFEAMALRARFVTTAMTDPTKYLWEKIGCRRYRCVVFPDHKHDLTYVWGKDCTGDVWEVTE